MTIEIIPVQTRELIVLTEKIAAEIWREHYASIITSQQIEYMLEKFQSADVIESQISADNYKYFLMLEDGELIQGYFAFVPGDKSVFLSKIYVRKENRGKGYGKVSMSFIKNFSKKNNAEYVWLTVNKNNSGSIEAYKKMGFFIESEIKQDIGNGFIMDDYKMVLKI